MVKVGNLWYLTGDMHIHTHHSDGERLEDMIAKIINCGFDFCSISDHDTYSGSIAALELAESAGSDFPIIVRGQEATCSGCHILAYGTLEKFSKTGTLPDVCRGIRDAGGYAVAAHPDWEFTRDSFRTSGLFEHLVENQLLDGVELMNFTPDEQDISKEWTNNYTIERFRNGKFFSVTAGSDAHHVPFITPDRFVGVFAETPDEKGILDAIFKKRLSVAVLNNCAIGTPEALELFYQLKEQAYPQTSPEPVVLQEIRNDGVRYNIESGFEDGISFCGKLQKVSGRSFFHFGHTNSCDLILGRSAGLRTAFCAKTRNGVELKSVPVKDKEAITPEFSFKKPEFLSDTEIIFSGEVNGKSFQVNDNSGKFTTFDSPLAKGKNLLTVTAKTIDNIPLGTKIWDYPIARSGVWQELDLLTIQAAAPEGKEVKAKFRFISDAEKLTLEMEVEDHFFCQPYSGFAMYMGDSIQFGIDPECAASENNLSERKIWELGIAMTDSGCELVIYNQPADQESSGTERWSYSGRREGTKQIYSVAIPPEILKPGKIFGFNMIYNINDGSGRRGYLAWRNGIGDRKRAADWGFIV